MTLLAAPLFIISCGSATDASNENFKVAMQTYLDSELPTCYFTQKFPLEMSVGMYDQHKPGYFRRKMSALVDIGFVKKSVHNPHKYRFDDERKMMEDGYKTGLITDFKSKLTYTLTDAGKAAYDSEKGGYCFGKAEVKEILNFTLPSSAEGSQMSTVMYSYTVSDIPEWAMDEKLNKGFPRLTKHKNSATTPVKDNGTAVLTSNGWTHYKFTQVSL